MRWRLLTRKISGSDVHARYRRGDGQIFIDIRLHHWRQFFDSRDPAPFRDRDLDDKAVDYIVTSYREIRGAGRAKIALHLSETAEASIPPTTFTDAIHSYFAHEAVLTRGRRRQTFRQGRATLVIGVAFLGLCTTVAQWTSHLDLGILASPVREGLTILGWVAMWRPIDILLYDWWPLADLLEVNENLSAIAVDVVYNVKSGESKQSQSSLVQAGSTDLV